MSELRYVTSSFCLQGDCVAVAAGTDGTVRVRSTKDDQEHELVFTIEEWRAFTAGVRDGEFEPAILAG